VTLVHLGSIAVARNTLVAEGATVAAIGPSGDTEHAEPYVHLGIRVTAEPNGYLDPLSFLPPREETIPPPTPAVDPAPAEPPTDSPEAPAATPVATAPTPEVPAPIAEAPMPISEAPMPTPEALTPTAETPKPERPQAHADVSAARSTTTAARQTSVPQPEETRANLPHGPGAEGDASAAAAQSGQRPLLSLELPTVPHPERSGDGPRVDAGSAVESGGVPSAVVAAAAALLALAVAGLVLRRRQLGDARAARAAAPVLHHGASRSAEDAGGAGTAQEDRLILDGDLKRVALGETEPLTDLDRDDDAPELIQVPDDPRCRVRTPVTPRRFHRFGPRPPSRCRRADVFSAR